MRGHHGLPEAQAAISGGNFVLCEDVEAGSRQSANQIDRQVEIVERAAAQADAIE